MCDRESFAKLRDQTQANAKQIADLAKSDAVQSEQIKTLFHAAEKQADSQTRMLNRLVVAIIAIVILALLALIWGALGERGFNAVTNAAQDNLRASASPREQSSIQPSDHLTTSTERKLNK